jgi:hypothetical protein
MSMMSVPHGHDAASSGVVNVTDDQAPSKVIPHSPEAGDQYYIGDCYARAPISQEWEMNT